MSKNDAIEKIKKEIDLIENKESNIFFFVIDTKGNPSGNLEYIYKLALILSNDGYNVSMLYQEDDFVGVGDWLGEKYAKLPHRDIGKEDVGISPSDILFIPELFTNVMEQTKLLACKRIVILQNFNFVVEQTPISSQWGDYRMLECITNTEINKKLINSVFPYVKTSVVSPYIDKMFGTTNEPKDLVVNIVSKNQSDVNKIIKPFYWKYPMYKFVSFRDLRGFPKDTFAECLRKGAITIWVDDDTNFGYSLLESLQSGSITIAKTPNTIQPWMINDETNGLVDACVWFNDYETLHKIIASVVRSFITDNVPNELSDSFDKIKNIFSEERTKDEILTYVKNVLETRKNELNNLLREVSKENK